MDWSCFHSWELAARVWIAECLPVRMKLTYAMSASIEFRESSRRRTNFAIAEIKEASVLESVALLPLPLPLGFEEGDCLCRFGGDEVDVSGRFDP